MARTPSSDDDAALRWNDFDDSSYVDREPLTADVLEANTLDDGPLTGESADGTVEWGEGPHSSSGATAAGRSRAASAALALIGGVVAVAYTIAWVIAVERLPLSGPTFVLEVIYQFAEFLAIVASLAWFATTIVLTRERPAVRAGWLALGTLVLMPWPVVLGVIA